MTIYLKVKPNQRFDKLEKIGNEWQVRLQAPATEGKVNEHLIEVLSVILAISKSKISLKKGKTSRNPSYPPLEGEDRRGYVK